LKSLGKPILILSIALVLTSAFFSVSPVLAENATENDAVRARIIEERAGEVAFSDEQTNDSLVSSELEKEASSQVEDEAAGSETVLRFSDVATKVAALQSFVESVSTGSRAVTGIYINENFSLNVGQQPSGSPGYITDNSDEVTQFGLAADYGSKGFLAHNYLSGISFFDLAVGMKLTLVYGDGSTESYKIEEIRSFEALQPNSPTSTFVDLDEGGKLSATDLFYSIYNSNNPVVLQTCIANHGVSTWGRVFIIAVPVAS
jgi:hypothetical protein